MFNKDSDRASALNKISVIQQHTDHPTRDYILKVPLSDEWMKRDNMPREENASNNLPDQNNPFYQTPHNPPNVRPTRALYFVYWDGNNLAYIFRNLFELFNLILLSFSSESKSSSLS